MTKLADFSSHRIEGFAHQGNTHFSVPLFSQIDGNLWTGGCPEHTVPVEFQFIISLYPWGQYGRCQHQTYLESWLLDSGNIPEPRLLSALADYINLCRAIGPTLVHCQAGLNRSALVTALALVKSGSTPADAIKLLREKRCDAVLCNRAFEGWLLAFNDKPLDWAEGA